MQQNNANNIIEYIRSKKILKEEKNFKFLIFNGNGSNFIRSDLLKRQNWDEIKSTQEEKRAIKNADFIWSSQNFHYKVGKCLSLMKQTKKILFNLDIFHNRRFRDRAIVEISQIGYSVFHTTPTTFIVKQGFEDIEFQKFMTKYKAFENGKFETELIPMKHCIQNLWLIKPGNQNQGRGIVIYKNQNDIIHFFQNKLNQQQWIIQKYIEKPLLYKNRKFDIRMWALITCKNEIFFYHDGYIRTSSHDYNLDNCSSNIHLTNNFQQKYFQNYGLYEPGNTLPIDKLFEYIAFNNKEKASQLKNLIISRMKDIVIDSFLAARKNMVQQKRYLSYELFGYDFLLDEDLRVWLLEINSNPYLGTPNEEMKSLIPKMIEEMIDIILKNKPRKYNKFELIYSESMQGGWSQFLVSVNQRQSFNTSLYPEQQLQQLQFVRNENTPILCKTIRQEFYGVTTSFNINLKMKKDDTQLAKQLYQHIYLQIQNYPFKDYDAIQNSFTTILTKIKIWKELEQKELKWYIKGFKLILESNIKLILLEKEYSDRVYSLILQEELPEQILSIMIEASYEICRIILNKRKQMPGQYIHTLCSLLFSKINLTLNKNISIKENINPEEYLFDKQIELLIKSLLIIGGQFDRKKYIPGETQNNEKSRKQLLENGGLIVIYCLQEKDLSVENINNLIKQFLGSLDYQDFFYQNQLLKQWIKQAHQNSSQNKSQKRFYFNFQNQENEQQSEQNQTDNSEMNKKSQKVNKTRLANLLIHSNVKNKPDENQERLNDKNETEENEKQNNINQLFERSYSNDNTEQIQKIPYPKYLDSFFNLNSLKNEFVDYVEQQLQLLSPKLQQFYKIKFKSQQKIEQREKQLSAIQIPNLKKFKFNKSASPSRQSERKEQMNKTTNQIAKIDEEKFKQNANLLGICQSQLDLQKTTKYNLNDIEKVNFKKNQVKSLEQIKSVSPFVRRHQNQIEQSRESNLQKEEQKINVQIVQQNKQPIKYMLINNKQLSPNSAVQKNIDCKLKADEKNQFSLPQSFQIQNQSLKKKQKEFSPSREFRKKQSVNINQTNHSEVVFSSFHKIRSSPKLTELKYRKAETNLNKYNYDIEKDIKNESQIQNSEFIQVEDILAQQNLSTFNLHKQKPGDVQLNEQEENKLNECKAELYKNMNDNSEKQQTNQSITISEQEKNIVVNFEKTQVDLNQTYQHSFNIQIIPQIDDNLNSNQNIIEQNA